MADGRAPAGARARPTARGARGRSAREPRWLRRWGCSAAARCGGAGVTAPEGQGGDRRDRRDRVLEELRPHRAGTRVRGDRGAPTMPAYRSARSTALVRFDMDAVDEVALTSHLGLRNLRWMSQRVTAARVATRSSCTPPPRSRPESRSTVVCYRALNERSGAATGRRRPGAGPRSAASKRSRCPGGC